METDNKMLAFHSSEFIKSQLENDIQQVHSDHHGIIVLQKGRIISYNSAVRDFFSVTRDHEVTGQDISVLLPPEVTDRKMIASEEYGDLQKRNIIVLNFLGLQNDIEIHAFSFSHKNYHYKAIVLINLAQNVKYARHSTQITQSVLTNLTLFLNELQIISSEKDLPEKILNHLSILSKAGLLFYSEFTGKRTMRTTRFLISDPMFRHAERTLEMLSGMEMSPSDEAMRQFEGGKVHEAPPDPSQLSFQQLDPIEAEKLASLFNLVKVYSVSILYNGEVLAVVSFMYNRIPDYLYHSAIELYVQNAGSILFRLREQNRPEHKSDIGHLISGLDFPAAIVNEKEIFLQSNPAFMNMLRFGPEGDLTGKSTREIADRVEFDNYLTNTYMRKKKISAIYPSVLIGNDRKEVPVIVFAGPYFRGDAFIGAFGLFFPVQQSPESVISQGILPADFPVPFAVLDAGGELVQSGTENKNPVSGIFSCLHAHQMNASDIHQRMQNGNVFITSVSCPDSDSSMIIFRLADQRKELFVYLPHRKRDSSAPGFSEAVLDALNDAGTGLMITDIAKGTIEFTSKALGEITGFTPEELRGKPHYHLLDLPEFSQTDFSHHKEIARVNTGNIAVNLIASVKHKNRKNVPVRLWMIKKTIDKFQKIVFLIQKTNDDTEKQSAPADHLHFQETLARVITEIKTPLNNLLGLCQLAVDESHAGRKNDIIQTVQSNGIYLHRLFEDIQQIHKIESGNIPVSLSDISMNHILKDAESWYNNTILQERINKLETEVVPSEKDIEFRSDYPKTLQIFSLVGSILIQSRKNGRIVLSGKRNEGRGTVTLSIRFEATAQPQPYLPISPPVHFLFDKPDVINDIHYRLCKRIIDLLGGSYTLSNEYAFQEFAFTLPSQQNTNTTSLLVSGHTDFNQEKILVMSSDPTVMAFVQERMSRSGLDFTFVQDGMQVLQTIRKGTFHAVWMDMTGDHPDGLETIWTMRHKGIKTPLIALVDNAENPIREKSLKMGCNDFLLKPLNESIVLHKMSRILKPQ